jgi:hypothetical protein
MKRVLPVLILSMADLGGLVMAGSYSHDASYRPDMNPAKEMLNMKCPADRHSSCGLDFNFGDMQSSSLHCSKNICVTLCSISDYCSKCGQRHYLDGYCDKCGRPCTVSMHCPYCEKDFACSGDPSCPICGKNAYYVKHCDSCGYTHSYSGYCDKCQAMAQIIMSCETFGSNASYEAPGSYTNSSGCVIIGNYTASTGYPSVMPAGSATQSQEQNNQSMLIFLEPYFAG